MDKNKFNRTMVFVIKKVIRCYPTHLMTLTNISIQYTDYEVSFTFDIIGLNYKYGLSILQKLIYEWMSRTTFFKDLVYRVEENKVIINWKMITSK